ncbi:NAD(P)H-dependent glycerol-3-phosphate dehydrogenase [Methyloterricola oryzae]|uniref:NAD(P)H-dependent glycerol-3-phosphate dehydrogenase n=1 Tax=Methyloterricola oryzae TaxID=1495050 RepID=UPI0005EAF99E
MTISVIGAGSWGTALALLIARNGHQVLLWGHHPEHIANLGRDRCNKRYLPEAPFPETLQVTADLGEAVEQCELALVSVPSHAFRATLMAMHPAMPDSAGLAWATKGLEKTSGRLLSDVVTDIMGADRPAAVLSGPTFASEVAAGKPTAITVASRQTDMAAKTAALLHNKYFRAYTTSDIVGVQLGGATKNVLAIAAGMADGLGFGANARAALITRGLAELLRLGLAMGGRMETLMGLAGVGDLLLTCTDNQSRNRRFGLGLGQGLSREEVTAQIGQEIEGATAASIIYKLACEKGIEMPITEQVYRILNEGMTPAEAVDNLLLREPKPEMAQGMA